MNHDKKIVVIGCGAGGGTASQFARKTDRKAEVTIFERGKYPQYSKCGLPYTISGIVPNIKDLVEFSEEWFKKAKINLNLETEVKKIDIENKKIHANNKDGDIQEDFDKLIICTGASPLFPNIKNLQKNDKIIEGVFPLRTIDDAKKISSHIKKNAKATIVGAGLIGLEMADCLLKKKMKVTIIEALPRILEGYLDEDMLGIIKENIPSNVMIYTNHIVNEIIKRNEKITSVKIKENETGTEKEIETDLLILATGCKPEIKLAEQIGCKIGSTGHIIVNEKSETTVKDVYAAGDCTEFVDFVTKRPVPIGLGSIVVRQAIAAGTNAAGGKYILPKGVLQTCTSEFFNKEIASVGPSKKFLEEKEIVSAKIHGFTLLEYFPGGRPISIKIAVDNKDKKIVYAQAVGENAAQRINIIASAMLGKLDFNTFRKLETAYAPPISPVLDVTTLVCDIISMKIDKVR